MGAWEEIAAHIDNRVRELKKLKEQGTKIVGYLPGDFMPEELVYASGAIPVCLLRGGDPEPVANSAIYLPRFMDTFCRAQIGYLLSEEEPLYKMIDLLVVPISDLNNIRAIADCCNYYSDMAVFRYGVPHLKEKAALDYYVEGLGLLKERLELLTGNTIKDDKLKEAISLYNEMRTLLAQISTLRTSTNPAITGLEFARLIHNSYLADVKVFVPLLNKLYQELEKKEAPVKSPRVMLVGSTLAMGDYKVLHILEEAGAAIVTEVFMEGIRYFQTNVKLNGDFMAALADKYFWNRQALGHFKPPREAMDFIIAQAKEFRVDGIVWYQLLYRETYDIASYYFSNYLKEQTNIPMLKIQSDYDPCETGPLRTRLETFTHSIRR